MLEQGYKKGQQPLFQAAQCNLEETRFITGDECAVVIAGLPYGRKFKDENMAIPSAKGKHINWFEYYGKTLKRNISPVAPTSGLSK